MPQLAADVDCVDQPRGAFVGDLAGIYSMGTSSHPLASAAMRWLPVILFCVCCRLGVGAETALAQDAAGDGTYDGRPASDYISQLADKDLNVRRRAAYILGQMGTPAKAAIPELVKMLEDRQSEPRWYAIDALGYFGPDAAEAVPAMIKSLNSKVNDAIVRRRGARSLGRIGPAAKEAIPTLEAALKSDDNLYRIAAAQALWQIDKHQDALPTIVDVLKTGDAEAAMTAALALADLKSDDPTAIAALIAALSHEDPDVRQAAVDALAAIGPPVLLPVSASLASLSAEAQREAATSLGIVLDFLRQTSFDNEQVSQRDFAAAAAPVVRTVLPALAKLLSSPEPLTRAAAGLAMAKSGSVSIRELLTALAKADRDTRAAAIEALVRLEAYLPRQRPLPANAALVQSRAIEPLVGALAHENLEAKRAAVRLFVALDTGPAGEAAEPLLAEALQSGDLATRRYADKALAQLAAAKAPAEDASPPDPQSSDP